MSLQLRALVDELVAELHQLQQCLTQVPVLHAQVGIIPPTPTGSDHAEIQVIEPELYQGKDALSQVGRAISDLYIKDGYSQKSARRTVGSVLLDPTLATTKQVHQLVLSTNTLKSQVRELVTSKYTNRYERFEVLHDACPGVMTLHLYRHIPLLDQQSVKSLRFTWKRKNSQYRPDKDTFLEQLQQERELTTEHYRLALGQLMERIRAVPDPDLRLQRPIKVHPVANVVTATQRLTVNASLPILVLQNAPYQTRPVPVFDASRSRARRSDVAQYEVLGSFQGNAVLRKVADDT